jgi:transposase
MSLPLHKRYEIVFLAKNIYGPQFGSSKIAKIIKCNRKTVTHWINRWEETKDLFDRPRSGAPRTTSVKQDQMMVDMALDDMNTTSKTIKDEFENIGITVSQDTIQRRLKDAGLKYSKPLSKPLLSEWHRQQRLTWAESMKNYDWSKVMATDETSIRLHTSHKYTWQRPGERKVVRTVKYPLKINVWGCLSKKGFGRVFWFKNNLNSEFLCHKIYRNALLPSARQHFGQSQWVLLEDNDLKHRSNYSRTWKSDHQIVTLSWPSHSPDVNPIENLWALLKVKVAQRRPKTLEDLVNAIQNEWNELPSELAYNLMNSMESRVQSLIDSSGDYTLY